VTTRQAILRVRMNWTMKNLMKIWSIRH
jgi:hypothetical protein